MRGLGSRKCDAGGFGHVVTNNPEIGGAPKIARGRRVVLAGDDGGAGEDEAGHRWKGATESDEHALEAREDTFAARTVFADDHAGRFAEPEGGAFGGRGDFEKILEHATPGIPMRAGAE